MIRASPIDRPKAAPRALPWCRGSRFATATATALGLGLLLISHAAFAQRIVVLEFDGDKRGKVRAQVVRALMDGGEVELVPLKDFVRVANKRGFKGAKAQSPKAIAAAARELKFQVAIDGSVRRNFDVRFIDAQGTEIWSKALAVKKGAISDKNAGRLAKAALAAAKSAPGGQQEEPAAEERPVEEKPEEKPPPEEMKPVVVEDQPTEQQPTEQPSTETQAERERPMREQEGDSHTVTGEEARQREDEVEPGSRRPAVRVGPKLITLQLGGTTTWRAYCSRPGVANCQEYDAKPEEERPAGDTVDFSPQVPYAGFGLGLEFFPLASIDTQAVNGIGVILAFSRGFSLTNVRVQSPSGESPEKRVISIDDAWNAYLTYRYYFGFGSNQDPLIGYVGLKGGIAARTFEVDPTAEVPLPGSHRRYPALGLDVSVPVAKIVRIEAGGMYFLNPMPGADEVANYGSGAEGRGWMAEAGLAGDIWGPVGYTLKFRLTSFKDTFTGQGSKWQNGGAAEETYTGLFWGVTARF